MGWKGEGHGLGKNQQGIQKAIDFDSSTTRFGLGFVYSFCDGYDQELQRLDDEKSAPRPSGSHFNRPKGIQMRDLINNIHKVLRNFASSQTEGDLVFDKSLTVDERKFVHREAHKLGLKTRSEGQGENRFLVVSRKRSADEIIHSSLNSGQFSKYKLISKGECS